MSKYPKAEGPVREEPSIFSNIGQLEAIRCHLEDVTGRSWTIKEVKELRRKQRES